MVRQISYCTDCDREPVVYYSSKDMAWHIECPKCHKIVTGPDEKGTVVEMWNKKNKIK